MTIDKQNPTQKRLQPMSLSAMLAGNLGLPVRSMPKNSRRDRNKQRAFLLSILEHAIELTNDMDDCFLEESSKDGEDSISRGQNRNQ